MRCICWNCGKKFESNQLLFKFTNFYKRIISDAIEKDNAQSVREGADRLLESADFFESEENLCKLRSANARKNEKAYIFYPFPYAQLLFFKESSQRFEDQEDVENFKRWLKDRIKRKNESFRLSIVNSGGGDIDIDQVFYEPEDGKASFVDTQDRKRYCPYCKKSVSFLSGRYREIVVSVIGGPRVSKSTAMTACASFFMEKSSRTQIRWEPCVWDTTYEEYEKKCLKPYREGKALQPTDITIENIPKVAFKVTIPNYKETINLMFVDLPGEFNNNEGISTELIENYLDLYKNVDYVWYCTDQGEVEQFEVKEEAVSSKEERSLPEHIQKLGYENNRVPLKTSIITSNMQILKSHFAKAKVIYILGKSDTIGKENQERYELYNSNEDEGNAVVQGLIFDVERFFEKNKKVKQYINENNDTLYNCFTDCFKNSCFIATSAYGHLPNDYEQDSQPYQCGLPFYWMLATAGKMELKTRDGRKQIIVKLDDMNNTQREKAESNLYGKTRAFLS